MPCHVHRSQEGIKQSMTLKDAMREWCVSDVVEAWYRLVASYSGSRPDLAASVLEVVRRYVGWIDIGLLVNDKCAHSGRRFGVPILARPMSTVHRTWDSD